MIRLSDHIAAAGGWLSLEAFMQLALYHSEEGYYSTAIENIGMRGDFSTTPTLSPILAKPSLPAGRRRAPAAARGCLCWR